VVATLVLENAGIPVPGETILLMASFLASSEHRLRLPILISAGVIAATFGDNLGFLIGYSGGRPLLERYRDVLRIRAKTLHRAERIFQRYGATTIFFARFVFGLRMIAGPLAGVLRMPWKKFALFNFLGATLWVSAVCTVGYLSGRHWDTLVAIFRRADALIAVFVLLIVFFLWRRHRANFGSDE
jgi:membrane protein DedA with SNARE-associated domain